MKNSNKENVRVKFFSIKCFGTAFFFSKQMWINAVNVNVMKV